MQSRRSFLLSGAAFVVSLGLLGWAKRPAIRRYGRFFLVNGWVLTAEDVRTLANRAL